MYLSSAGRIAGLADAAAAMNERHFEALIHRPHRIAIAKVPFAENAGARSRAAFNSSATVTSLVSIIGAAAEGVDGAGAVVVAAGHQAGPRGRADGADVEVRQDGALFRHGVDIRRANERVAVDAKSP